MGLLNLLKSKFKNEEESEKKDNIDDEINDNHDNQNQAKYDEQVGKMDSERVFGLLDLISPDMKKMLLAQTHGIELSTEQKKLLEKIQNTPEADKLELLTTDHLPSYSREKEKIDFSSYVQTKWKELEEHYGKKITDQIPSAISDFFPSLKGLTVSDISKAAQKDDNVALRENIAYSVLLDAHNRGNETVAKACGIEVSSYNHCEKEYQLLLKSLDTSRQFEEKRTAERIASAKALLGR